MPEGQLKSLVSREASILVNNLLFVAITFTVLLGTVYPLIAEAVRGVRVSVGEPYFNKMAVPGGIAVLFLMGVGPVLPWGTPNRDALRRQFIIPAATGAGRRGRLLRAWGCAASTRCSPSGSPASSRHHPARAVAPVRVRMSERKEGLVTALVQSASKARRRFGGYVVHLGIIIIIVAVAASSAYVKHTSGTMRIGETLKLGRLHAQVPGHLQGRSPTAPTWRRAWK